MLFNYQGVKPISQIVPPILIPYNRSDSSLKHEILLDGG